MCESYSGLKNFQSRSKRELIIGERVIADRGFPDCRCILPNNEPLSISLKTAAICARHETLNRHLKSFNVSRQRFRRPLFHHTGFFYAVLSLVMSSMENGSPLIELD